MLFFHLSCEILSQINRIFKVPKPPQNFPYYRYNDNTEDSEYNDDEQMYIKDENKNTENSDYYRLNEKGLTETDSLVTLKPQKSFKSTSFWKGSFVFARESTSFPRLSP
jgi:hypothetical protein